MSEQSGGMRRPVALVIGAVLVVWMFVGGLGGVIGTGDAATVSAQPEVDNTVTRIGVHEDGTATWTVSIRTRLASDDAVNEYEAFQERFRQNTSRYLDPFQRRITGVVARAENETGREMQARDFSATTSIQELPRRWGIVTYRFTWSSFAETRNGTLVVGDVFQGGYYLAADDILVIAPPEGYAASDVSPTPANRENGSVRWQGPIDFAHERPSVTYEPATTPATTQPAGRFDGVPWLPAAIVALLLTAGGATYAYRRHSDSSTTGSSDEPTSRSEPSAGSMTDEEQVLALLREHSGRAKQSVIVEEFDWSASKTSRVVSSMAEEGAVEKLRVGRENLVALPDDE